MKKLNEYLLIGGIEDNPYESYDGVGKIIDSGSSSSGEVLRVYSKPFNVIDCRFIAISSDRGNSLYAIRQASYKFQYINPSITEKTLRVWLRNSVSVFDEGNTISSTDIGRIARETFGVFLDVNLLISSKYVMWTKYWDNEIIQKTKDDFGERSLEAYKAIVKERSAFARMCWNNSRSKKSVDDFIDAVRYVHERYGFYSNELVAEQMKVTYDHVVRLRAKHLELFDGMKYIHGKAVASRNSIYESGEAVHYDDRQVITKQRIFNKSKKLNKKVTRPTINKHWYDLEPHFIMLNELLD